MKKLLVISNHDVKNWSEDQKKDWDTIKYVPFPNIDPYKGINDLIYEIDFICNEINEFVNLCNAEGNTPHICLQGEFSVCYNVFVAYAEAQIKFVFPTTERREGKFEFVRWR